MRSKKNMQKMHFTRIRLIISRSPKERDEYINSQIQNVCTKSMLRIHSVQHYYRNASTERTPQNNIHYHIFCFVHQCSVLHSFGQKQKIVLDFYLFL